MNSISEMKQQITFISYVEQWWANLFFYFVRSYVITS